MESNQELRLDVVSSRSDTPTVFTVTRTSPLPERVIVQGARGQQVPIYVRPPENTRLNISDDSGNNECVDIPVDIKVSPRVSIAAARIGVRDYVFSGRVLPGRAQEVRLYRTAVGGDGTPVLTARTSVQPDGTWRMTRRFTGSGRFGFYAAVPTTTNNVAGRSANRPTVIH